MHRHPRCLEDRSRILAGPRSHLAAGAIHRHNDVASARNEGGQFIARGGAVRCERHGRPQGRRVGKDRVGRGGRRPQGARRTVDGHRVRLRGSHNDRVAVAYGLSLTGLHQVVAADTHARNLQRISHGVSPRGHRAGNAVHLKHDGGVGGGNADACDADHPGRGQGRDAENDAGGGCEGTQVGSENVQGAGGGGTQRGAQVVAHGTPVTGYWCCWSA